MRTAILTAILATAILVAPAGAASDDRGAVVAAATGAWKMSGTAAGSTFDIRPFSFNVRVFADGSVAGRYNYTQVRDGVELTVAGSLDCAFIQGNQAWVGGVIEKSSRASLLGLDMWFQVQDNGKPRSGQPDMSSTIGAGAPGTGEQYCLDHPPVLFPFFLDGGDLHVRPAA